ncbi:MAG TPA: single-stranded DNA-binding protein [Candidatus Competibacteraceae bacterium]|nr:single-stranded DNA-binding protein [Candidatus Competibacteraceae bacterium]
MARGVNKVILIGNCGRDPEVRYMPSGDAVANVTVATSEQWKDKNGQLQDRTEWHTVVFFRRLAEIAGEYLRKGSPVYVEGRLRYRKYTDKNGQERTVAEIHADEMQLLGSKSGGAAPFEPREGGAGRPQQSQAPRGQSGTPSNQAQDMGFDEFDDDIPF